MKEIPLFYGKPSDKAIFTAKDKIKYKKRLGEIKKGDKIPKNLILVFSGRYEKMLKKWYKTKRVNWSSSLYHILSFKVKRKTIGLVNFFGIGSPFAMYVIENLIAGKAKNFIVLGLAGSIQEDFKVGDIGIADRAIRDEGASYHYLAPGKYSYANKKFTDMIEKKLKEKNVKYRRGTLWSIDVMYRETKRKMLKYKNESVLGVEMESSSLFAVAKYRKVNLGFLFTVSDTHTGKKWSPEYHTNAVRNSSKKLLELAIDILGSLK